MATRGFHFRRDFMRMEELGGFHGSQQMGPDNLVENGRFKAESFVVEESIVHLHHS